MDFFKLIIWLVFIAVAVFVIGFAIWSFRIVYRQKRSWSKFANKHKLSFIKGKLMETPAVFGNYGDYRVSIYSEEQRTSDIRGSRFRTVIELMDESDMDFSGAIASGLPDDVISALNVGDVYSPNFEEWNSGYRGLTNNTKKMNAYLTKEKFNLLDKILRRKNDGFIFIFHEDEVLLRYDTARPLESDMQIEKMIKYLISLRDNLRRDKPQNQNRNSPAEEEKKSEQEN